MLKAPLGKSPHSFGSPKKVSKPFHPAQFLKYGILRNIFVESPEATPNSNPTHSLLPRWWSKERQSFSLE